MRKSGWISGLALLLVMLFLLPMVSLGQTWGPKYVSMTWGSGGYYEYLPAGYNDPANAGKKYPVLLFIHGIGEQGNGTSDLNRVRTVGFPTVINSGNFPTSFNVNGNTFSFIAIVPQFSGWPSAGQVENILNYIQANYRADESRLYLTGLSMGGGVTWDYASSSPAAANRLAAILPVCGASSPNSTRNQIMANAGLPVLATHNNLDPTVPVSYTHGFVDGMNSYGVNPPAIKVIWNSAVHNAWSQSYDPYEKLTGNLNAYEWLLQYSRGSATPPPPASLSASIASNTGVSCNGLSNGSATVSASGGTAPYSYSWSTSPVQTSATASNLAAGTYTVTVRDANNATATASVTINQPARLNLTVTPGTIALYGGTTSVSLTASGGTAPYSYSGPVSNVAAGTYTYTVTDARGCQDTKSVTITQPGPTPVVATVSTWKDVNCNGGSDGSATIDIRGGVAPFTYSWNTTPVQTTPSATNLAAGTYTFTVRDAQNTTSSVTVSIGQPGKLNLTVTPGSIPFAGGSTNVSLSANGGTSPYTFAGQTSNVRAGTYTYTVTDAHGCADTKTITLTDPAPATPLLASISSATQISCFGTNNGSATVAATGGVAPYTYSWNTTPVQTGATATGLAPGNYIVTVRDAAGTTATANTSLTAPSAINFTVSAGTISTYGGTTTVTLSATGGTPGYSYSGPTTNVSAGTYTYTVIDARGCTDSKTITITQPAPPPSALRLAVNTWTDVSCFNGTNGSASVTVTGGTAPYTYSWNTTPVQTTATANNLRAGTYVATVRDVNGETQTVNVTIVQPAALNIAVSPGTINVNGGTTTVSLSASGGTGPYAYSGPVSNVRAGTYTYVVTDSKGCTDSRTITITEPAAAAPLVLTTNHVNATCSGLNNGSASVSVAGGVAPYTYTWNTIPAQSTAAATGLVAGNYVVTVRDAANTTVTANVVIAAPAQLVLGITPGSINVNGGTTSVMLSATGGTAPYAYSGPTTNVTAGTYTYSVTDAAGCTDTRTVTISEPPASVPVRAVLNAWTNVSCSGGSDGTATIAVIEGSSPYSVRWNTVPVQTTLTAVNLKAGTYSATVQDANSTTSIVSVTITEPAPILLTVTPGVISVAGGTTNVTLQATGGTAPYTYSGSTTNVAAGSYTYTVTDSKGCNATQNITITEPSPAPPTVSLVSITNAKCAGSADGSATVAVSGGKAPYTFQWSTLPAQITASATGLSSGIYTVTVTDANGQKASTTVIIDEPAALTLDATAGTITTVGGTTTVTLSTSGGTAPYTYSGASTTNVTAGTYTYVVTDVNGCSISKAITIVAANSPAPPSPAILTARATVKQVNCYGGNDGSASVEVSGGKAPYTISWSGATTASGPSVSGLAAGTYTVSIKDADQAVFTLQVEVSQPSVLALQATANDVQTIGGTTQVTLQASGGTAPYAFTGSTTNVKAGTYTYVVTDANGCSASKTLVIREVTPLIMQVTPGTISCYDGTTQVTLRYSGGVAPYIVTGDTVQVKAGVHVYTVTDAAGTRATQTIDIQQPEKLELIATPGLIRLIGGTTTVELSAKGGITPYTYLGEVSNVKAGNYTYNVVDANACKATASVEVREPSVVLSSFDALKSDTSVDLKWATSYEYAIDHFEIERSDDNQNFTIVTRVTSLWNSLRTARYVTSDIRPFMKRNYYRIVAVTSYGERIVLDQRDLFYDAKGKFTVKNMPTMLDITIENNFMEPLTLILYDINGKPLKMKTFTKQTYLWNTKFDLQGLPSGSYIISAQSLNYKHAKQVIKL
ncbi:MAG: hypothetical protein WBP58_07750 [Chitinophagaceae bacterium]